LAPGTDRLLPPGLREALAQFRPPSEPQYALVGSLDAILLLRRNPNSLMAAEDLARLVGLWEYDPDAGAIAWISFVPAGAALREAVARTEEYVRRDLGDARSFSLDSPKSRRPRIEELRALAARS
jgi:hypothetical protein